MRYFVRMLNFRPIVIAGAAVIRHHLQDVVHDDGEDDIMSEQQLHRWKCVGDITNMIEEYRITNKIPGMSVAVSCNGELIYEKGFGYQDMEGGVATTKDMRSNVASISKLFTAQSYLQLMNEYTDQLNMESKLHQLLTDFPTRLHVNVPERRGDDDNKQSRINFHQWNTTAKSGQIPAVSLLSHTAGVRTYHYDIVGVDECRPTRMRRNVSEWYAQNRDTFAYMEQWPGEWYYSNLGYVLIGVIMERCCNKSFAHILSDDIKRLNLRDTHFHRTDDVIFNYTPGYRDKNVGNILTSRRYCDYSYNYPPEGLVSTVADLHKFANHYVYLMKEDWLRPLRQNYAVLLERRNAHEKLIYQGLGWRMCNQERYVNGVRRCQNTAFHGGSTHGHRSFLQITYISSATDITRPPLVANNLPPVPPPGTPTSTLQVSPDIMPFLQPVQRKRVGNLCREARLDIRCRNLELYQEHLIERVTSIRDEKRRRGKSGIQLDNLISKLERTPVSRRFVSLHELNHHDFRNTKQPPEHEFEIELKLLLKREQHYTAVENSFQNAKKFIEQCEDSIRSPAPSRGSGDCTGYGDNCKLDENFTLDCSCDSSEDGPQRRSSSIFSLFDFFGFSDEPLADEPSADEPSTSSSVDQASAPNTPQSVVVVSVVANLALKPVQSLVEDITEHVLTTYTE